MHLTLNKKTETMLPPERELNKNDRHSTFTCGSDIMAKPGHRRHLKIQRPCSIFLLSMPLWLSHEAAFREGNVRKNREESLKPNVKLDMSQRTRHGRRQGISGSLAHSWMEAIPS